MTENRKQVLEMLAQGKVTAEEAERLLVALDRESAASAQGDPQRPKPKYLRIVVHAEEGMHHHHHHGKHGHGPTQVNIRIPMQLLRAGVKLASLIPVQARGHVNEALKEHGVEVDLTQLKPENLEELVDHLSDLTVDVDDSGSKVRIFCES